MRFFKRFVVLCILATGGLVVADWGAALNDVSTADKGVQDLDNAIKQYNGVPCSPAVACTSAITPGHGETLCDRVISKLQALINDINSSGPPPTAYAAAVFNAVCVKPLYVDTVQTLSDFISQAAKLIAHGDKNNAYSCLTRWKAKMDELLNLLISKSGSAYAANYTACKNNYDPKFDQAISYFK